MGSEQETKHPVTWYRGTIFSAMMVAATAFTCPGIFGALNGMGAGGGASPDVSNAANAIVFAVIAVGSLFAGAICNQITPKWTLVVRNIGLVEDALIATNPRGVQIGTLGYAPYAAGFYVVDRYKVDWLLLFGAVTCGISACFLWVASGAVFLGYTEENRKGLASMFALLLSEYFTAVDGC